MNKAIMILLAIFLANAIKAQAEDLPEVWSNTQLLNVEPTTSFAKKIPLNLIWMEGTTWTEDWIRLEIRRLEKVYSQCEVSFSPITIAKSHFNGEDGTAINLDHDFLYPMTQPFFKTRPLIFFAEKTIGERQAAWSVRRGLDRGDEVSDVTYYFTLAKLVRKPSDDPGPQNQLSHELGHVLFDEPHNTIEGNILCGSFQCMGESITKSQCDSIDKRFFN